MKFIVDGKEMNGEVISLSEFMSGIENSYKSIPERKRNEDNMREAYENYVQDYIVIKIDA